MSDIFREIDGSNQLYRSMVSAQTRMNLELLNASSIQAHLAGIQSDSATKSLASALASMPNISHQLAAVTENMNSTIQQAFADPTNFSDLNRSLLRVSAEKTMSQMIASEIRPLTDFLLRDRETREAFAAAGFVPSPFMEEQLSGMLVSAHKAGKPQGELEAIIVEHYDNDNAAAVAEIVARLMKNDLFHGRERVLQQSLEAYRDGTDFDAITTYAPTAMIEGVTTPFLLDIWHFWEEGAGKARPDRIGHTLMTRMLRATVEVIQYSGVVQSAWVLVDYTDEHFFKGFCPGSADEAERAPDHLHRHPLLHGYALEGSQVNTLRCFLMLDCLGMFIPYARKELDKVRTLPPPEGSKAKQ